MIDRQFSVYRRLVTDAPADQVFATVEQSLRATVGGTIQRIGNSIHVTNGTNNLNFAFVGDLSAVITATEPTPGTVDLTGNITLKPNAVFWICAIVGAFCLWFMWAVNILYFVMDPRSNYQSALDRVDLTLPGTTPPVPTRFG